MCAGYGVTLFNMIKGMNSMKTIKLKIEYTGGQVNIKLDNGLKDFFTSRGFEFIGSGYSIKTGVRDMEFEKKE